MTTSNTPLRVLVLDDDANIRDLIQRKLQKQGWEIEAAENGRYGLRTLLHQTFDVVVVDVRMPEMDGRAFVSEARKIWPWLGFVVVTGYCDEESMSAIRDLHIRHVLIKPFSLDDLQAAVEEEAKRARAIFNTEHTLSFAKLHQQFGLVRRFSESVVATGTLSDAMVNLCLAIGDMMACDTVAILDFETEERLLVLNAFQKTTKSFQARLIDEILRQAEILGGLAVSRKDIDVQYAGVPAVEGKHSSSDSIATVPIIISGQLAGIIAVASVQSGAFNDIDLSFFYHIANHFSTVLAAFRRMRQMAVRDGLTGLYNRRYLEEALRNLWLVSQRHQHNISIMLFDVDHFKTLNDTHGHLIGDRVLVELSRLTEQYLRASDIIGRYGGDEIAVILPETDGNEARYVANRLLNAVRDSTFLRDSKRLKVTLSIGIASSRGVDASQGPQALLQASDQALYEAKRGGRNRISIWDTGLSIVDAVPSDRAEDIQASAPVPKAGQVLVVDDEPLIQKVLCSMLQLNGYEVVAKTTIADALQVLKENPGRFDLLLTDLSLPGESGFDLLDALKQADESIVRIVITGNATKDVAVASMRHGAFDFIEKPFSLDQLSMVVNRAMEYRAVLRENRRYQTHLEDMVRERSLAITDALKQLKTAYVETINTLSGLIEVREHETGYHSQKVRHAIMVLAREMKVPEQDLDAMASGAILHDIGKVGVPDRVLLKPGVLDQEEIAIMRRHVDIGHQFLSKVPFLQQAAQLVYQHHERFDGQGYPRGLAGKDICLGARIFAVIDSYDAMRSDRVYRKALSVEQAVQEIEGNSGKQFDPEVVAAFSRCQPQIEASLAAIEAINNNP